MHNSDSSSKPIRIGITHGDFNGISYEIILKSFSDSRMLQMLTPVFYGQSKVLSYYKKSLGIDDFNYSFASRYHDVLNENGAGREDGGAFVEACC